MSRTPRTMPARIPSWLIARATQETRLVASGAMGSAAARSAPAVDNQLLWPGGGYGHRGRVAGRLRTRRGGGGHLREVAKAGWWA
jgi:hypothetical protein